MNWLSPLLCFKGPFICNLLLILHVLLCRYKAVGIRLDSGDLAYLSCEARKFFCSIEKEFGVPGFGKMTITASNDLNEETLDALNKQVIIYFELEFVTFLKYSELQELQVLISRNYA